MILSLSTIPTAKPADHIHLRDKIGISAVLRLLMHILPAGILQIHPLQYQQPFQAYSFLMQYSQGKQWFSTTTYNIINTHCNTINSNSIVFVHYKCNFQFVPTPSYRKPTLADYIFLYLMRKVLQSLQYLLKLRILKFLHMFPH